MVGGDWRKNYNMGGGIMKNKRNNESFLKEREGRYYRRFSRKEKEGYDSSCSGETEDFQGGNRREDVKKIFRRKRRRNTIEGNQGKEKEGHDKLCSRFRERGT